MATDVYRSIEPAVLDGDVFTSDIPLGPPDELLHGTLDSGLQYYVRRCSKPRKRAAIALAVKVGSLAEDEEERGVAHILEHLAFNATEVGVAAASTPLPDGGSSVCIRACCCSSQSQHLNRQESDQRISPRMHAQPGPLTHVRCAAHPHPTLQTRPNHQIVRFLESIGASFGACQNAYTSTDETVYTLMVPCGEDEEGGEGEAPGGLGRLDEALAVLADWAARIRCVPWRTRTRQ